LLSRWASFLLALLFLLLLELLQALLRRQHFLWIDFMGRSGGRDTLGLHTRRGELAVLGPSAGVGPLVHGGTGVGGRQGKGECE
jgi:hypothetical protein